MKCWINIEVETTTDERWLIIHANGRTEFGPDAHVREHVSITTKPNNTRLLDYDLGRAVVECLPEAFVPKADPLPIAKIAADVADPFVPDQGAAHG